MKIVIALVNKRCEFIVGDRFTAVGWSVTPVQLCPCGCGINILMPVIQTFRHSHN